MNAPGGKRVLLAAAAALIGVAGIAGVLLFDDDHDDDRAAPVATTTTVPPESTEAADATTTSTTTSTTAPASTTTTRVTTTTSRTATSTTRAPTTTVVGTVCGSGRAAVAFTAKDLTTDALSSSFTPQATVDNQVSAPIEVAEIVLEVVFPGNDVRTVTFATAGTVIGPGTTASFTAAKITTSRQFELARFTRFTYFTQGQPTTCRVTTP